MRTVTRSIAILAALGLLAPAALAQESSVSRGATAIRHDFSNPLTVKLWTSSRTVLQAELSGVTVELRYALWSASRAPVVDVQARLKFGPTAKLTTTIKGQPFVVRAAQVSELTRQGPAQVDVPPEAFHQLELVQLKLRGRLGVSGYEAVRRHPLAKELRPPLEAPFVNVSYQGVAGMGEDWGWSVPTPLGWDEALQDTFQPLGDASWRPKEGRTPGELARLYWSCVAPRRALRSVELYGVELDTTGLGIAELRHDPGHSDPEETREQLAELRELGAYLRSVLEGQEAPGEDELGALEVVHEALAAKGQAGPQGPLLDRLQQQLMGTIARHTTARASASLTDMVDAAPAPVRPTPARPTPRPQPAAPRSKAVGDFAQAKAGTVERRFVLGETRKAELLEALGPGLELALPEGDAVCYLSGRGKEEFRYLFDASGRLAAALELSPAGKEIDWSPRLARQAPRPTAAAPTAPTSQGRTFVLIVGINTYRDSTITPLRYAESDARAVYSFYGSHSLSPTDPDRVQVITGQAATRRNVLGAVRRHLEMKATAPEDTAVLYFAGHGFSDAQTTYLATYDTERDALPETAIAMADLQSRWGRIKAGTRLFIADACHSGGMQNLRGLTVRPRFQEQGRVDPADVGTIFISAAQENQLSVEHPFQGHGVFTNALVNGLKGDADVDGDRHVTLGELSAYLQREVPRQAAEVQGQQAPVLKFNPTATGVRLTR